MIKLPALLKSGSSVFTKFLTSYIIAFTIPLSILGIVSYLITFDIVKTQTEKTYLSAVEDIKKNVDSKMGGLSGLTAHISELDWVKKIMNLPGSTIDYTVINPYSFIYDINDLNTFKEINGFVSEITVYFHEKNLFISTQGKYNLNTYFEEAFVDKDLTPEDWSKQLSTPHFAFVKNPTTVFTYALERKLLTYIHTLPAGSKTFNVTLFAYIDENILKENLKIGTVSKNGGVYIIDSKNNLVSGLNMRDDIKNLLIAQKSSDENIINLKAHNGDDYIVFRSNSTVNDWSYITVVPLSTAMAKVNNIKMLTLSLSLLSLVAGLVISYILALRNYTPLANIIKDISPRMLNLNSTQKNQNEYNFLQKALHSMLEFEDRTKEEIEIYKPLARNSLFVQLLEGTPDPTNSKLLRAFDISFNNSCFTCASIVLDSEHTIPQDLQTNIILKIAEDKAATFFVEVGAKHKVIILNTAYEEQVKDIMDIVISELQEASIQYKAIGIGKTYKGLDDLGTAYNEANAALDYRFIRGNNSIIYYREIEDTFTLSTYYYHTEKDGHMVNFIRIGNYDEAIKLFNEIVDKNMKNTALTPAVARNLFYNMAASALKALEDMNISTHQAFHLDKFFQMDTIHEMKNYIEELYRRVCDIILDEKESKNTRLRDDIISYINDNLTDSNLTLTSIADKFGSSLAYLSRFIKDQTGTNFVDYLNTRRIEMSKPLLLSDMTIREVSHRVGFDNDLTFRRLFKKYVGINPGEYKKMDSSKN